MITIDVLTSTRAEYGLMRPLLRRMLADEEINLRLLVTGTHLSEKYGMTYSEIEGDGIPIYLKLPILGAEDGALAVSMTMARALEAFTLHFMHDAPDSLLLDGDRYEALAVCIAAVNANVPCIHLGGGATTEGAADEMYRHAITKMSCLHFPTTETYRRRIIQMGEAPERVFTVGSLGIENIKNTKLLSREELEKSLSFSLKGRYAVVTFHPVTLEKNTAREQVLELLTACDVTENFRFIFTMANADNGGAEINQILTSYVTRNSERCICVSSLGSLRYLSALKYCSFVMGNSSSGLIEAPSFGIPTINIGDRQKGRIKADSVIDCEPDREDISRAIKKALSNEFREKCRHTVNPNGDGRTSEKIVAHIQNYFASHKTILKKSFYDLSIG